MTDYLSEESPAELQDHGLKFEVPPGMLDIEARKSLANEICDRINACEQIKAHLPERWDQVDKLADDFPIDSLEKPWETAPTYHFPVVGPRIRRGAAFIAQPMTKSTPYFIVRIGGVNSKRIDPVESILHFFLERANYSKNLRIILDQAQRRGESIAQLYYEKGYNLGNGRRKPGKLCMRAIDPANFVIHPNNIEAIEDSGMAGYRFSQRLQWAREMQDSGNYFDDPEVSGNQDDPVLVTYQHQTQLQSPAGNSVEKPKDGKEPGDEVLDFYEVWIKKDLDGDGVEEQYQAVVTKTTRQLMMITPYQIDKPWFVKVALHEESGRFFNENSRGHQLVGPQFFGNDCRNMTVWCSMYTAMPPVYAQGWALPDEAGRSRPGQIVSLESGGQATQINSRFDPGAFPQLIQLARQDADDVGGVSGNGLGSSLQNKQTTATEASYAQMGQSIGVDEDSAWVGFGLCELGLVALELLGENFDDWYEDYKDSLPEVTKDDFFKPYILEVNGQTPLDTPQAVAQQVTQLLQVVAEVAQINPGIFQAYPNLVGGLLRAVIESSTLPGKDTILPTKEEEASQNGSNPNQTPGNGIIPNGAPGAPNPALQLAGMGGPPGGVVQSPGSPPPQGNGFINR